MQAADVDRLAALLAEPGVRRFLCDDQLLPYATVEAVIDRSLALAPQGFGLWGIEAEGWIGCIGLQPVSPAVTAAAPALAGEVEPTIALQEAAWGRGHAAEALLAILRMSSARSASRASSRWWTSPTRARAG
jgi:RimJ/RimL family protein N-acetyltransferase